MHVKGFSFDFADKIAGNFHTGHFPCTLLSLLLSAQASSAFIDLLAARSDVL
jgi:hypothetical protein